jgi:predicted aldo/keto reductase-like oxidoreductase
MSTVNRRDFLKGTVVAGVAAANSGLANAAKPAKKLATDWVNLGNSGIQVTRLAFGTGTLGGRVQRELGQEQFTALVRHAYDRGIRFFESADGYDGMHEMLARALKGIPRDSYKLMTKMRLRKSDDPRTTIDRFRKELGSDYFDILLLHCVRTPNWPDEFERLRDVFSEVKGEKIILSHGASCHGLPPLRAFPGNDWLDVALLRINHDGTRMDNLRDNSKEKGDVSEVVSHIERIHRQGTGVIGMKVMGEGRFTSAEERKASLKFVMDLGTVDSVTIGFKTPTEIDEAIERIETSLNA